MTGTPAVSIVVPSRGGAGRLPVLLESLASQTSADFEVVVVLDGDVDDSEGVLAARHDVALRTVVLPQNQGRSGALNAGFAVAEGEILVRCDDDFVLPPAYVAHQQRLHSVGARGVIGMPHNQYPDRSRYAALYGRDNDAAIRRMAHAADPGLRWRFWGGNVSVRREDFERVGGYDTDFRRYGWEDIDWGYRLHRLGREIQVSADVSVLHHVAATSTAVRASRAFDSGWSRVLFENKHHLVVEETSAPPRTAWERLVARASTDLDHDRIGRRGARIDRSLRMLPRAIARKRIALLVEASARAGYRQATSEPEGNLR